MFGHLDYQKPGKLQQYQFTVSPSGNFNCHLSREKNKLSTGKTHKHSTKLVQDPPKLTQTGPFGIAHIFSTV